MKEHSKINEVVFASFNVNKILEVKAMLQDYQIKIYGAQEFTSEITEETGSTLDENAILKAQALKKHTNLPVLADDSGLFIKALPNVCGIHSARFAEKLKGYDQAILELEKNLQALGEQLDYSASFICVMALVLPGGEIFTFKGEAPGELVFPGRGTNGFAYDKIFVPKGNQKTFAEITGIEKNSISHRKKALQLLANQFFIHN